LDSHFLLQIVGLDMGIDQKGNVWFIEANTKPVQKGMENLDRKLYQKYLEAKKLIGKG
jgi:D-alanine-D-alanine ligase-like ATP-grasp enzyme